MIYSNFVIYYPWGTGDDLPFRVRYRVYCEENGFLLQNAASRETDSYDSMAAHAVVLRASTGEAVAVVRVIPWHRTYVLPFERFCPGLAVGGYWGEVSRIGVLKASGLNAQERKEVLVHLFKAVYQLSLDLGVSHWVCMMPGALQIRMGMLGVLFDVVGEAVEYHGLRQPCVGVAHRILSSLETHNPSMYNFIVNR